MNEYLFYEIKTKNIINTIKQWKLSSTQNSKYPQFIKNEMINIEIIQHSEHKSNGLNGLLLYFLDESYHEIISFDKGYNSNYNE